MLPRDVHQESLFIPVNGTDQLHVRRIYRDPQGSPVFMLHGSIENGRVFYSESGKGLAPYLAEQGYDVFVGDLRGRGKSRPRISRHSSYGQTEAITEDIPAFLCKIRELKGQQQQTWIGHSWGGVLLASYLARFPTDRERCRSMVFMGTKRRVCVFNWHKALNIDFLWGPFARLLISLFGYLPARQMGLGSDNESNKSHLHCMRWVRSKSSWVDEDDQFDYGQAMKAAELPPILHIAGAADTCLGHPEDVRRFMEEVGEKRGRYFLFGKKNGYRRDYGHIDLLVHPEAAAEIFPVILDWTRSH